MSKELNLSKLPRDVTFDILSRLPIKTLIQFTCVSKSSLPLISHPHFIKLHLSKSTTKNFLLYYESIDYTRYSFSLHCPNTLIERSKLEFPFESVHGYFRIVGSCNGLVCFFDTNYFTYVGTVFLWNPSIRKFWVLKNCQNKNDSLSHMVIGFGFVPKVDDFKVVKIVYDLDFEVNPDVFVYTLKDDSWRKIEGFAPCFLPKRWTNNVFVKSSVNWLASKSSKLGDFYDSIMAFDLGDETFRAMELPDIHGDNYDEMCLCSSVCGESLCLFFCFRQMDCDRWEMWLMKEYGVADSWTKQFNIVQSHISLPLCCIDSGEVLLVMKNGKLVIYDPNKQEIKDCGIWGTPGSFRLVNYMTSLVLLDCRYNKITR
ncbi:hypothetical protein LguiB_010781 [Lonicera macranthoides]